MIIMNLELDNLFGFDDFKINFSYPKKIVNSTIDGEFLNTKPNFRYKKVNIIMGANASGKTSLGKAISGIFNLFRLSNPYLLYSGVRNSSKTASFKIDFVIDEDTLYRVESEIYFEENSKKEYKDSVSLVLSHKLSLYSSNITKSDSYEKCVKKLKPIIIDDKMNSLREIFKYESDFLGSFSLSANKEDRIHVKNGKQNLKILEIVLKSLDTDIVSICDIPNIDNSFVIEKTDDKIIVQDGKIADESKLSSGTRAGLNIADIICDIKQDAYKFFYCDEQFTYIHSEIEKTLLSIMISSLGENEQFFFTSHNMELLDMDLPVHSFTFLRKNPKIEAVYPSDYIKKNDVSLYNAVSNDIFNCTPDIDKLFEIEELSYE